MYVTRPLSFYKRNPSALSLPPPEGPNSGVLVILDEESEPTFFFGLFKSHALDVLPLAQNKKTELVYGTGKHTSYEAVAFVPVPDQPLSSNMYYVIRSKGNHKGKALICSREEDASITCCCRIIHDVKPQPFNHQDAYQQFKIHQSSRGYFKFKSSVQDGIPPSFMRHRELRIRTSFIKGKQLGEAQGIDATLRASLPDFNFPTSYKSSKPVVVGKWYTPFVFIKDGNNIKDQIKKSMYYEVTLEQKWEQIFERENHGDEGNYVVVDVDVKREVVSVAGREVQERYMAEQMMWFRSSSDVGLSSAIVERMKWEEQRFGWIDSKEEKVRVNRKEEYGGIVGWRKFGCYVLVESFVVKRMDGSLVLTYDFRHTNQIRSKWD